MNNSSRVNHLPVRLMTLPAILWIMLWLTVASVHADSKSQDTVLVLGDSISAAYGLSIEEGWVAQLQDTLDENEIALKVINASVTGDTTANGLGRLKSLLNE